MQGFMFTVKSLVALNVLNFFLNIQLNYSDAANQQSKTNDVKNGGGVKVLKLSV